MDVRAPKNIIPMTPEDESDRPLNKVDYNLELQELEKQYEAWRQSVLITIDTQRKNLMRADSCVAVYNSIISDDLAKIVAHAQEKQAYWAINFTKKVLKHMDEKLSEVEDIFKSYDYKTVSDIKEDEPDKIFEMVPYCSLENLDPESMYFGTITYTIIRPYGEKLADTMRMLAEKKENLKSRLQKPGTKAKK